MDGRMRNRETERDRERKREKEGGRWSKRKNSGGVRMLPERTN